VNFIEEINQQLKEDFIKQHQERIDPPHEETLDRNKTLIIIAAMVTLTSALISGRMSEAVYSGLMGSFLAFTFGRIFSEMLRQPR
jgi:hypothetical protein